MSLMNLKETLSDYAKDIRMNIGSVLDETGAPGLNNSQIWSIALACAYATKNEKLIQAAGVEASQHISPEGIEAAKAAATIMAMNNIYYRFTHMAEQPEFTQMPAKLRMSVIGKPGIEKADFELICLAVSAVNGCGKCVNAHIHELHKVGVSNETIHSAVRVASVINATAQALVIG